MINNIISTITSTFKKLVGGSCLRVILLVAILLAAAGFIYFKFIKVEKFEEEEDVAEFDEMDEEIEEFDDEDLDMDDDEEFAGIGDMDDEEMQNLGQL